MYWPINEKLIVKTKKITLENIRFCIFFSEIKSHKTQSFAIYKKFDDGCFTSSETRGWFYYVILHLSQMGE